MELKILKNLEMHMRQMYEELSNECKDRNDMDKRLEDNAQKLAEMK